MQQNNISTLVRMITFAICCSCLLLSAAKEVHAQQKSFYNGDQKRIAIVIGVGAYEHASTLPNPPNDAASVGASLERLGFQVVKLINPTFNEMRIGELDFTDLLIDADVAVLYYAGHSVQVDGANLLIPVNAELQSIASLPGQTFELARLVNRMDRLAKTKIVILDACRDNPFVEQLQASVQSSGETRSVGLGLASIDSLIDGNDLKPVEFDTYGTVVSYAAAPGRVAEDGTGNNSPYTTALLKRLEEPGLEIGKMLRQVAADVITETDGRQKPEYLVKLTSDFYFLNPEPDQCDYLAAEPINNLSIRGVEYDAIKTDEAIPACLAALKKEPEHPRYLHNLARSYDTIGRYSEAIPLYEKSAEQGYIHAINNLGVMYINGQGVNQDFEKGAELLKVAKARGHLQSRVNLQGTDFSILMKEEQFRQIQARLKESGVYDGAIDGQFGPGSKSALSSYQKAAKLVENGLTLETLDHMGLTKIIPNFSLN